MSSSIPINDPLARLREILPPPESPVDVPSEEDWERCERAFGGLPADYRYFVESYGSGTIDDFLSVLNPGSRDSFLELEAQAKVNLEALWDSAREHPDVFDMSVFPTPGGLLPAAVTLNGDTVYWETMGAPAAWTIAVLGPRAPELYRFEGGIGSFLAAVLDRTIVCDRFPSDFPSSLAAFVPSSC